MAVYAKQQEELADFIEDVHANGDAGASHSLFTNLKIGQRVRVEDDGVYLRSVGSNVRITLTAQRRDRKVAVWNECGTTRCHPRTMLVAV